MPVRDRFQKAGGATRIDVILCKRRPVSDRSSGTVLRGVGVLLVNKIGTWSISAHLGGGGVGEDDIRHRSRA